MIVGTSVIDILCLQVSRFSSSSRGCCRDVRDLDEKDTRGIDKDFAEHWLRKDLWKVLISFKFEECEGKNWMYGMAYLSIY